VATVAVVGGGYGGAPAAKALDEIADVVLIDPKDAFVHNIAALRGLVNPEWTDRVFYPYERLLRRGRVVRGRAVRVDANAVTIDSGESIAADFIVLASGSSYPFPAKMDVNDSAAAKSKIAHTRAELAKADRVLLLGAGPVGGAAGRHADVVVSNIHSLIEGRDELVAYEPAPPLILLPLGPAGGVSLLPGRGFVGAEVTAQLKGHDLFAGRYAELFNLS